MFVLQIGAFCTRFLRAPGSSNPYRSPATRAPPPWTAVIPSNRAGRHRAARHGRRWADPAGRRHDQRPDTTAAVRLSSSLARQDSISDRGQYSRYMIRSGCGKGFRCGPPRASQPVIVLGAIAVSAAAPAMSTQMSPSGSSGSPYSLPAGTGRPSRTDSVSVATRVPSFTSLGFLAATAPPLQF
jgi:hypothetical protein